METVRPSDQRGEEEIISRRVREECGNPHHLGFILEPDGEAVCRGQCGDTMMIFLRIVDGVIETAAFMTDGCSVTVACGSVVTRLAEGRAVDDALSLCGADVERELNGLSTGHHHCAVLAAETLTAAVLSHLDPEGGINRRRERRLKS